MKKMELKKFGSLPLNLLEVSKIRTTIDAAIPQMIKATSPNRTNLNNFFDFLLIESRRFI